MGGDYPADGGAVVLEGAAGGGGGEGEGLAGGWGGAGGEGESQIRTAFARMRRLLIEVPLTNSSFSSTSLVLRGIED